ncbi:hypothetical protein GCM10010253_42320 [Streptomyces badius]|uniref:Uncharacterized protein n=1 Tax=Streptomyces badius TaxID=1941 RepID=A0ABQ2TC53_STRBA|nr:hypothetical protein GCM10010253_42320 [Streptomyces badius]
MDGRQGQTAARGQLAQPDLAPGVGHPLQQIEGALKGLHPTAGRGGLGVGCAGVGRRHVNGPFEAEGKAAAYRAVPIRPTAPRSASVPVRACFVRVSPIGSDGSEPPLLAHATFRSSKSDFYFVETSSRGDIAGPSALRTGKWVLTRAFPE